MKSHTRKKKNGGAFLFEGATGCAFGKPPLKCKNNSNRMNNTYISKLMDKRNANIEYKISKNLWEPMNKNQDFSISVLKKCELNDKNVRKTDHITRCKRREIMKNILDINTLLIEKDGGKDLALIVLHPKNYKYLFKAFLQLMKGVEKAHNNNIVHNDIKPSNIVCEIQKTKIVLRLIDYGLSHKISDAFNSENLIFQNSTYYPYWPFELGCFDKDGKLKHVSDVTERYEQYNKSVPKSSGSISLGKLSIDVNTIYEIYKNTDFTDKTMIYKGIDVYSLGITLANLMYKFFSISYISYSDYYLEPLYFHKPTQKYLQFLYKDDVDELADEQPNLQSINLSNQQIEIQKKLFEKIYLEIGDLIAMMTHIDLKKRLNISDAIKEYEKLIPSFDNYLTYNNIEIALKNQYILSSSTKIPYIETPNNNNSTRNAKRVKKNE